MTSRLNPYISFGDNARQALEFYKDVFGGDLNISTFGEYGQQEAADLVMHGQLDSPSAWPPWMRSFPTSATRPCATARWPGSTCRSPLPAAEAQLPPRIFSSRVRRAASRCTLPCSAR